MKREIIALTLLLLLFAGALLNIRYVDGLADDILHSLSLSESALDAGSYDAAMLYADAALERFLQDEDYTHIFIRHSEIDCTADAFYELKQSLLNKDGEACSACYAKLKYHVESIATMEHLSLGSIL